MAVTKPATPFSPAALHRSQKLSYWSAPCDRISVDLMIW